MKYISDTAKDHFKLALMEYMEHGFSPVTAVYKYCEGNKITPLTRSQMLHLAIHK